MAIQEQKIVGQEKACKSQQILTNSQQLIVVGLHLEPNSKIQNIADNAIKE